MQYIYQINKKAVVLATKPLYKKKKNSRQYNQEEYTRYSSCTASFVKSYTTCKV